MDNQEIAAILEGEARLLELQQADPFQVHSFCAAADSIRTLNEPVTDVFRHGGEEALRRLDGVGRVLASSLREIVETGKLGLRDRLEGELFPEKLFLRVAGIGDELAWRIRAELGIESLEELRIAAHDGRLLQVDGIGHSRCQGIQDALAKMLDRCETRCR